MDFLRNRMFRQTLLCRKDVKIDRELKPYALSPFYVSSQLIPSEKNVDVRSTNQVKFVFRGTEQGLTTNSPLVKAALMCLAEARPAYVAFPNLLSKAFAITNWEPITSQDKLAEQANHLGKTLLEGYVNGLVDFHSAPVPCSPQIGDKPVASRLARYQAQSGVLVTSLCHSPVMLYELARHILQQLDGTRDRAALLDFVLKLVHKQVLVIPEDGLPNKPAEEFTANLQRALDRTLMYFAHNSLLTG
jgi:methyltransferase-like protein